MQLSPPLWIGFIQMIPLDSRVKWSSVVYALRPGSNVIEKGVFIRLDIYITPFGIVSQMLYIVYVDCIYMYHADSKYNLICCYLELISSIYNL